MVKSFKKIRRVLIDYFYLPIKYAFLSVTVIVLLSLLNLDSKIIVGSVMVVFVIYLGQLIFITQNSNIGNTLLKTIVNFVIFTLMASPLAVYALLLFASSLPVYFPRTGSEEAWIGFGGSIIGGTMTIFALIFSINHSIFEAGKRRRTELKPIISSDLVVFGNSNIASYNSDAFGEYLILIFKCNTAYPAYRFKILDIACKLYDKSGSIIYLQEKIIDIVSMKTFLTVNDEFRIKVYYIADVFDDVSKVDLESAIRMSLYIEIEFYDIDNSTRYLQKHSTKLKVFTNQNSITRLEHDGEISISELKEELDGRFLTK
jgi:hypothetical protein